MLVGRFEHAIDSKNRIVLPAPFRPVFEKGGYLVKHRDGCLALMTDERFAEESDRLLDGAPTDQARRDEIRWFASAASDVRPDGQGRIVVQPSLKEHAGLDRDCVVIGALDVVEVWDRERFEAFEAARATEGVDR